MASSSTGSLIRRAATTSSSTGIELGVVRPQDVGDRHRQRRGLDADAPGPAREPAQRRLELHLRGRRLLVVVGAVLLHGHGAARCVRGVKARDQQRRVVGLEHEQRGGGHERVRDGPLLDRRIEQAEVRQRLRMAEHRALQAGLGECAAQPIDQLLHDAQA